MKRLFVLSISLLIVLGVSQIPTPAFASPVLIYVDSAPDILQSADYPTWEAKAFSDAASWSFVNMDNGINPDNSGTTNFQIQDEVTYGFGDFGKRLTWVYFVPGETKSSLENRFQVSLINEWEGEPTLDYYEDEYGETWLQPEAWVNYDIDGDGKIEGVVGAAGVAWAGADTQAGLDDEFADWELVEETWTFTVKLDGKDYQLEAYRAPVPLPGAIIMLGSGLIGLIGLRRRTRK